MAMRWICPALRSRSTLECRRLPLVHLLPPRRRPLSEHELDVAHTREPRRPWHGCLDALANALDDTSPPPSGQLSLHRVVEAAIWRSSVTHVRGCASDICRWIRATQRSHRCGMPVIASVRWWLPASSPNTVTSTE